MSRWWWLLVVLACGSAHAQTCYKWKGTGVNGNARTLPLVDSPQLALDAIAATCPGAGCAQACGVGNTVVDTVYSKVLVPGTFPAFSGTIRMSCSTNGYISPNIPVSIASDSTGGCTSCQSGRKTMRSGAGGLSDIPGSSCISGCYYKKDGVGMAAGGSWTMSMSATGQSCNSNAATIASENGESEADCDASGTMCRDTSSEGGQNCGVYNGDRICVGSAKPGTCVSFASGGVACVGSGGGGGPISTPPAPNNGTPGVAATPDVVAQSTGGTTINYYTSTTVSGSSSAPSTGSGTPPGGTGATGTGVGGASSSSSSSSSGGSSGGGEFPSECEGAGCTGTTPDLPEIGTLNGAFSNFWTELQDVPIIAATGDVSVSFSGGACPAWSDGFSVMGQSFDIDFGFICTWWAGVAPVLSVVMLVFFGLVAFRILFSA